MAMKVGDVAVAFGVTPQTIRNWVKQDELKEFFSPQARRETGNSQAEFLATDLDVCNSIKVLLRQKADWRTIAENLRSGWRDTNMPPALMVVDEEHESASSLKLVATLAAANERNDLTQIEKEKLEEEIQRLRDRLDSERSASVERIRELERKIADLEKEKAVRDALDKHAVEDALLRQELEFRRKGLLRDSSDDK